MKDKQLPTFKVGQKVWFIQTGEWHVLEESVSEIYPLRINLGYKYEIFTIDGKRVNTDKTPVIFHKEQKLDFSEPEFIPEVGQLCFFWHDESTGAILRRLKAYCPELEYRYLSDNGISFKNCCPYPELPPHIQP